MFCRSRQNAQPHLLCFVFLSIHGVDFTNGHQSSRLIRWNAHMMHQQEVSHIHRSPPDPGDHHSPPKFLRPHWPTSILPGRKSATRAQPIRDLGFNELWQWKHVSHMCHHQHMYIWIYMNIMNQYINTCFTTLCCETLEALFVPSSFQPFPGIGPSCCRHLPRTPFPGRLFSIFHWDQFQRLFGHWFTSLHHSRHHGVDTGGCPSRTFWQWQPQQTWSAGRLVEKP